MPRPSAGIWKNFQDWPRFKLDAGLPPRHEMGELIGSVSGTQNQSWQRGRTSLPCPFWVGHARESRRLLLWLKLDVAPHSPARYGPSGLYEMKPHVLSTGSLSSCSLFCQHLTLLCREQTSDEKTNGSHSHLSFSGPNLGLWFPRRGN